MQLNLMLWKGLKYNVHRIVIVYRLWNHYQSNEWLFKTWIWASRYRLLYNVLDAVDQQQLVLFLFISSKRIPRQTFWSRFPVCRLFARRPSVCVFFCKDFIPKTVSGYWKSWVGTKTFRNQVFFTNGCWRPLVWRDPEIRYRAINRQGMNYYRGYGLLV